MIHIDTIIIMEPLHVLLAWLASESILKLHRCTLVIHMFTMTSNVKHERSMQKSHLILVWWPSGTMVWSRAFTPWPQHILLSHATTLDLSTINCHPLDPQRLTFRLLAPRYLTPSPLALSSYHCTISRDGRAQPPHPHLSQPSMHTQCISASSAVVTDCPGKLIMLPPIVTNYISSSSNHSTDQTIYFQNTK